MSTVDNFHITTEVTQKVTRFLAFIFSQFLFVILELEISWSRKIHCDFISILLYLVLFFILILFLSKKPVSILLYYFSIVFSLSISLCPVPCGKTRSISSEFSLVYPFLGRFVSFQENPFKERISEVFTRRQDLEHSSGCEGMCFEEFLEMMSVFSEQAPRDLKVFYAFKIYGTDHQVNQTSGRADERTDGKDGWMDSRTDERTVREPGGRPRCTCIVVPRDEKYIGRSDTISTRCTRIFARNGADRFCRRAAS